MTTIAPPSSISAESLTATTATLTLYDNTPLFYRAWLPTAPARRAILLVHRGHEHSGRFQDIIPSLADPQTALFAWDARGHGNSPGDRGYAPSFSHIVRDLDFFARHLSTAHNIPLQDTVVLGHSIGAVSVAAWVHDYAPPIRAMVLVAPALKVRLYVPLAIPGLRFLQKIRGTRKTFIKSYVKSRMLTHDPAQAAAYDADPLIAKSIAVNMLLDLHDTSRRLVEDAATIETPTLVLNAGKDWVVDTKTATRFFNRLGSPEKRLRTLPGMHHDLLHEKDRQPILDEIRTFISNAFSQPATPAKSDPQLATQREFEQFQKPLSFLSPKGTSFRLQTLTMKTLGRLSQGIRLGWQTGFNSGPTLDYVYQNQARGSLLLGRLFDRQYLDAIGWRGIRLRKTHLQELLTHALALLQSQHQSPRVVDIAAGPGRYLLELARQNPAAHFLLRDADAAALDQGRALAEHLNLSNVTFQSGDAFDQSALAKLAPAPNLAVISGIFELFPDNALILRSLRGLATAMQNPTAPAYLVYTGQPWHPQLEMIARVLVGPGGKPWIMRRRSQRELDALVASAGFHKIDQRIDPFGIFTVSLAILPPASA